MIEVEQAIRYSHRIREERSYKAVNRRIRPGALSLRPAKEAGMFGSYFNNHFIQSLFLIGPEGAAIFSLLVFRKEGIEGTGRRVNLAIVTIIAATAAAMGVALFGKPVLTHMGITLGAVAILGGFISTNTGVGVFHLDFLQPFRMQSEKKGSSEVITFQITGKGGQAIQVEVPLPAEHDVASVVSALVPHLIVGGTNATPSQGQESTITQEVISEEATSKSTASEQATPKKAASPAKKRGIVAAVRGLFNDFTRVGVPLVFPMAVGPAYTAWLFTQEGGAHPALMIALMAVIVCSMIVTLIVMLLVLLVGEHEKFPAWIEPTLEKFGGVVFILYGIMAFIGGIMQTVS
jgi:small neutral amino acid transporter SnatA (MarC family)